MKYLTENPGLKVFVSILFAIYSMGLPAYVSAETPSQSYVSDNVNGSQTLIGHVPMLVKQGQAALIYHANQNITAQIIMPLQNQSTLTGLIKALHDPTSPNYHHFLTPAQFSQQFGSSSVDTQSVQSYLKQKGVTVLGQSGGGTVLNVSGPVSAFEKALGLHINYYQRNDGLMFFAPDAEPTIPATLAGKILAVGGLDNLPKYQTHLQHLASNSAPHATGSGPGGFLAPNDVKTAYNMNTIPSNGDGQTIGLFELQGYSPSDIQAYAMNFGLVLPPINNVVIDGFSGVSYPNGADEVTLDIEIASAMAPLSTITVFEAPNTTQSWIDEWNAIAANTAVKVISCSWGEPELDSPTLNFDNNIFQEMAAQGQSVFVAAGDSGAYDAGGSTLGVDEPADQPFVTGVGISKLTTGANGVYSSESASLYGGGGVSAVWSIPDYQVTAASQANAAALVSTTMRNVPDVALTADPSTGYAFYINGSWGGWWGSSIASPIWAAFMACVNEGLGNNAPIGFVNAALYQLAQTSNYTSDFHSITTGNNGYYPAEPGFNDATGLGSFNGLNLYNDLLANSVLKVPEAPFYVEAFPGNAQVNVSGSDFNNEQITYYNVKRSLVSGGPYTTVGTITNLASGVYIDNTVVNGTTYYYVMSAVNPAGESPNSVEFSATPSLLSPAPGGLNVRVGGSTLLELNWNLGYYTSSLSFNVKRSAVSGGPYTTVATLPNPWSNIYYGYWDQTAAPGTTYYYVVSAVTPTGEGPNSSQVSATTTAGTSPPNTPTAPTGLQAETVNAEVVMLWNASTGAASYNVKRATVSGGPYTIIASGVTNPAYIDSTVTPGTTYYYVVSAVDSAGESANSSQISVPLNFPSVPPQAPPVPSGFKVVVNYVGGSPQVALSWNASTGATLYNITRSTVGSSFNVAGSETSTTSYTDVYNIQIGQSYYYTVNAQNSAGTSANTPPVAVTITGSGPVIPPNTPTGLQATAGSGVIALNWSPSLGAATYNLKRSLVNGGPYTAIDNLGVTSLQDSSVTVGYTYYYVVSAVNQGGESPNSSQVSATVPGGIAPVITSQPVSTTVTAPATAAFSVTATGTPAPTYQWMQSINGGAFTNISGAVNSSYTIPVTTITNNGTQYEVVVSNPLGSVTSNPALLTVNGVPLPNPPTGLQATAGSGMITLNWSASQGATSYNVKRSLANGGPYTIISVSPNPLTSTSFTDPTVAYGNTYYYVVSALNSSGESANSSQVSVNFAWPLPSPPTGLQATAGNGLVALSWNTNQLTVSYNLKKATTNGGPYTTIASINYTSPMTYNDTAVTIGTTYYYVISAVNPSGESGNSSQASSMPGVVPSITSQPNDVSLMAPAAATFSVVATGTPAPSYQWMQSVNGGAFTNISGATGSSYTTPATSAANSGTQFEVVVSNSAGSVTSNPVLLTVNGVPLPNPPAGLQATAGTGMITVSWSASQGATSYNVKRSLTNGGPYTTISSNLANTAFTDPAVAYGNTYYYVVSALNSSGESANSSQVSVNFPWPLPPPPTGLQATAGNGLVALSWNANQLTVSYNVKRATASNGPYTTIGSVAPNSTVTYNDTAVTNGTTYYYVISSVNPGGESGNSSQASATPSGPGVPVITSQPVSMTVTAPAAATFSVTATGTPAPSYQWKQSINGGAFTNISGATGSSYTTPATSAANNGTQFEVAVSNSSGSVTSNIVVLAVISTPVIIASPTTVNGGQTITVTVTNGPGYTGDYVGLYPVGAGPNGWVAWDYLNGAHAAPATGSTSANLTFTAPGTSGQYEVRLYLNNSNTVLATSSPITVNAVTPTITASPSTINAGQTITVTVANGPGYTGDYVGLYPVGAGPNGYVSWDYLNGAHSAPATGMTSATLTFTAPGTAGQYEVRLYLNNSNTVLATSSPITVNAVTPTITASPSTINAGQTITVTVANGPGYTGDYVGLYPVGAGPNGYISWDYLNGAHSAPATGMTSATLTFTAPGTSGQYEVRLYLNNSNTVLATSSPITVNAVTPTITASPSTINAGQTITVTVANGPGYTGDYVGLYPVGAGPNGYISWDYLNGAHTAPATGQTSATLTFTAPGTAGQYEVRLYLNNSNTLLVTSSPITVNAPTPTITASPSTVSAGQTITVTVTNGPGYTGDYVGLYPVGAGPNGYVSWDYLNGAHTAPATGQTSATLTFTVPSAGQYEVRLYLNNSNTVLATSSQVTSS